MPFLSLNQQCQSTEGKISHPIDLHTPNSPGVFQLCLWPVIAPGYLGEVCDASHQPSDAGSPQYLGFFIYSKFAQWLKTLQSRRGSWVWNLGDQTNWGWEDSWAVRRVPSPIWKCYSKFGVLEHHRTLLAEE